MTERENIILIGPMGAGKTSNGRWLAKRLAMHFIDLDSEIEKKSGVSINTIFEQEGESGFRQRECALLRTVLHQSGQVIATGGGTVLDADNRALIQQHGLSVYLDIPPEMQLQRLANDKKRPLLQYRNRAERLHQLAQERNPIYHACADLHIDMSRLPMSQTRPFLLQSVLNCLANRDAHA